MKLLLILSCCVILYSHVSAQSDLQKGLRLYYPFSGSVSDSSGNNNNPDKNHTELTTDRFGNPNSACHFNGKDSYVLIPDSKSLHLEDQITLCVWIKPLSFYKGKCHVNSILMKGTQTGVSGYCLRYDDNIYRNDGNCYAKLDQEHQDFSGPGIRPPAFEPYAQLLEWQSLICTCDGKFSRLYINGKEVKSEELVIPLYFTNKNDLYLGRIDLKEFPYWLNADIDDLRIYDRALNTDEISAIAGNRN